jgi:thiamine biosynthesis lipoprotein
VTTRSFFAMGTVVEVTSADPRAHEIVCAEFARLEKVFSLFDPSSELSKLNETGQGIASADLFRVLIKAKEFYELSAGAFDVTIAPLSLLWKRAIRQRRLPSDQEIAEGLSLVGFDAVYLDPKTRTVRLLKSGARIDLGGIAKGYAVDCAVAKLRAAGVQSALVNAGGNLYGLGSRGRRPWGIGIRDPRNAGRVLRRVDIADMAVATAGDYEQYFVFENRRYSHIINPMTGRPADADTVSATVVAPDAVAADALSTVFMLVPGSQVSAILSRTRGVRAILIDGAGKRDERRSPS